MRLIDADKLCADKSLCAIKYMSEHGDWKMSEMLVVKQMLELTSKIISNAETIDPIKHGHWIEELVDHGCRSLCSECGYVSMQSYGCIAFGDKYNYCPNCGAKMDEERTQDET